MSSCKNTKAFACVRGETVSGTVRFLQRKNGVLVTANISGLPSDNPSGFFAFHIHEGKDCSGENFSDTKGHFNPQNKPHPDHAGDMPSLISFGGKAYLQFMTDRFKVKDIIGRTVVIHASYDDFHSQPAGNAGMKIACGVIKETC